MWLKFRYLGMTVTSQKLIDEDIKSTSVSDNACYHSDQNSFSSHLLRKKIKINIYKTITLPEVYMGAKLGF
jgi:hypothetical protein